jgi:hypothetical protein
MDRPKRTDAEYGAALAEVRRLWGVEVDTPDGSTRCWCSPTTSEESATPTSRVRQAETAAKHSVHDVETAARAANAEREPPPGMDDSTYSEFCVPELAPSRWPSGVSTSI